MAGVMTSSLQPRLEQLGAQFETRAGWSVARCITSAEAETRQARDSAAIVDVSHRGKLLVQGEAAAAALASATGVATPDIQRGAVFDKGFVYRLRRDLIFASVESGDAAVLAADIGTCAGDSFVTVTDVTHGRSELRLVGPQVAALMSKVCALDLTAGLSGGIGAWQTSVAKTRQLVVTRSAGDLPGCAVIGGRASAAYLWDVLMEAGADLSLVAMGQAALDTLDK